MTHWKSHLIEAYRFMSQPYRQVFLSRMTKKGEVPIFVLFYHRVADSPMNAWTMSRADFQKQIDWFQENFDIVDLQECQRRIASGFNARPTLSITFDDGYSENCEFALPMLIERRIPVTYFVTTHHTSNQQPFPHDVDLGHPLPVNTIESLRALDLAGVEIAAHSRTHPDFGQITCQNQLIDEVVIASHEMESLIGRPIRYFAFPFGQTQNLSRDTFAILKEMGFLGVCSAYGGWNEIGGDNFHIQRIHGDPNFSRMKNWLTFDPRIQSVERFDYSGGQFDAAKLEEAMNSNLKTWRNIVLGEMDLPIVDIPFFPTTTQFPTTNE